MNNNNNNNVDKADVLNMTLEQYAEKKGFYISSCLKQSKLNNNNFSNNTKFDRIDGDVDMEEDDEDDLLQINVNDNDNALKEIKTEQEPEPDTVINDKNNNNSSFDLRDRLNENSNKNSSIMPKARSMQWRLMYPNNLGNRPAGMSALRDNRAGIDLYDINQRQNVVENNYVANSDYFYRNNNNNNRIRYNNNNNQNNRNRNRFNNRNIPYNNNNNNGRNNINNNYNQRRNQMNNNRNFSNSQNGCPNNKQQQNSFQNNNQQHFSGDLAIEIPNNNKPLPLMSTPQLPPTILNATDTQNLLNTNANNCTAIIPNNNFVNPVLTQLSTIAETLLTTLRNGISTTVPKYDMKIQKEIHTIQNKQMAYKCSTGEIISSDGPGLDVECKPTTSGITLNHRFALN